MSLPTSFLRPLRATIGALLGIALTGAVSRWLVGADETPWLVAPMGASAVLLFAVPASPLAAPWNAIAGNVLSAFVGVGCATWLASPLLAAAAAVALAVGVMGLCRCTHPPGGAVALTAVLGGPAIHALGWGYAAVPIAVNTSLLLGTAWLYGRVSGSPYPHRAPVLAQGAHGTSDPPPLLRAEPPDASIEAVLDAQPDALDIDRGDLIAVLRQLSLVSGARRWATSRCEAVMSKDVISATLADTLEDVRALIRRHALNILPVVDHDGRPVGVLRPATAFSDHRNDVPIAGLLLAPPALTTPSARIPQLLELLLVQGAHEVLVVDDAGRLVGLVTAADVLPLTALTSTRLRSPLAGRSGRRRRRLRARALAARQPRE